MLSTVPLTPHLRAVVSSPLRVAGGKFLIPPDLAPPDTGPGCQWLVAGFLYISRHQFRVIVDFNGSARLRIMRLAKGDDIPMGVRRIFHLHQRPHFRRIGAFLFGAIHRNFATAELLPMFQPVAAATGLATVDIYVDDSHTFHLTFCAKPPAPWLKSFRILAWSPFLKLWTATGVYGGGRDKLRLAEDFNGFSRRRRMQLAKGNDIPAGIRRVFLLHLHTKLGRFSAGDLPCILVRTFSTVASSAVSGDCTKASEI